MIAATIGAALSGLFSIVDQFVDDGDKARELKAKLEQGAQAIIQQQLAINLEQAKHPSLFVAGARPALTWLLVFAWAWNIAVVSIGNWAIGLGVWFAGVESVPAQVWLQPVMSEHMLELVGATLGVGAWRTVEKVKGVARENMARTPPPPEPKPYVLSDRPQPLW